MLGNFRLMANQEHLSLLGQGVESWEIYRQEHPGTRLDLRGADLSEFDLKNAHLIGARFNKANLRGINLSKARLDSCDFSDAFLLDADLRGACLRNANFNNADLQNSELSKSTLDNTSFTNASLFEANLTGAYIDNTNFDNAYLRETVFVDISLRTALNLDKCEHRGPSIIDHRTIENSGNLSDNFLRGCGLPDMLIDYLPSIINQPIQFHSCFISYSTKNEEFARRIYADLQGNGVRCWYAPEDMKIGDKFRSKIDEVIHIHEKLLLVLSGNSISSSWVEKEVETAFEKENTSGNTVLFPIRLDDTVMSIKTGWAADIKRTRHIGDFRSWKDHDSYKKSFTKLLDDLKVNTID